MRVVGQTQGKSIGRRTADLRQIFFRGHLAVERLQSTTDCIWGLGLKAKFAPVQLRVRHDAVALQLASQKPIPSRIGFSDLVRTRQ